MTTKHGNKTTVTLSQKYKSNVDFLLVIRKIRYACSEASVALGRPPKLVASSIALFIFGQKPIPTLITKEMTI